MDNPLYRPDSGGPASAGEAQRLKEVEEVRNQRASSKEKIRLEVLGEWNGDRMDSDPQGWEVALDEYMARLKKGNLL